MNQRLNRLIAFCLSLVMALSLCAPLSAHAAEDENDALPVETEPIEELFGGSIEVLSYTAPRYDAAPASTMYISDKGVEMIKHFEGCRLTAYKNTSSEKYYTIGYGHYGPDVSAGMTISQAKAESFLRDDLNAAGKYVNNLMQKEGFTLTQDQFDAVTSFTFNLGQKVVVTSGYDMHDFLVSGNYSEAKVRETFGHYNTSGGKVLSGLTKRRISEANLFLTGAGGYSFSTSTPSSLTVGSSFDVKGYVDSFAGLRNVTAGVYDVNGSAKLENAVSTTASPYSLTNLDSGMKFGSLQPGVYRYLVTTHDCYGTAKVAESVFPVLPTAATLPSQTALLYAYDSSSRALSSSSGSPALVSSTSAPSFSISHTGGGSYSIKNLSNGKYLAVSDSDVIYSSSVSSWKLLPTGSTYAIVPTSNTAKALTFSGTSVKLSTLNLSTSQRWLVGSAGVANPMLGLKTPQLVSVTPHENSVTLTWKASAGAEYYRVFRKEAGGSWEWVKESTRATSFEDTTVESGKTYTYTVRCITPDGGDYISSYDATGLTIRFVTAPQLLSAEDTGSGVLVRWKASAGADGYRVYRKLPGDSWSYLTAFTTDTQYLDPNAAAGDSYLYTVRAINAPCTAFQSDYYSGISIPLLNTPVLTSVDHQSNSVKLTWKAVPHAQGYRVYRKVPDGSWSYLTAFTTGTTYIDTTVSSGSTYLYTVRCINEAQDTFQSSYDSAGWRITYVDTPVLVSALANSQNVTLTWEPSAGAEGYRVYRKSAGGSWTVLKSFTVLNTFVDPGASAGDSYVYTVRAINRSQTAFQSDYDSGIQAGQYGTPVLTGIAQTAEGIHLSWQGFVPSDKGGYRVYRKTEGGSWSYIQSYLEGTSFIDTTAESGQTYVYTVRSINPNLTAFLSDYDGNGLRITAE